MNLHRLLPLAFFLACVPAHAQNANTADCLNPQEAQLADLVNDYRQDQGLARVPISFSLSSTGQWHVWDLETNHSDTGTCNLHSWSNARPAVWQPVCYTPDHAQAAGMWNKPREVSGNAYASDGYENAAWTGGAMTAATALQLWKGSSGHNDVILNRGGWSQLTWRGLGVGISQHGAVLWFGTLTDPLGTMLPCTSGAGAMFADDFEN